MMQRVIERSISSGYVKSVLNSKNLGCEKLIVPNCK